MQCKADANIVKLLEQHNYQHSLACRKQKAHAKGWDWVKCMRTAVEDGLCNTHAAQKALKASKTDD